MNLYKKKLRSLSNKFFVTRIVENLLTLLSIFFLLFITYHFISIFFGNDYELLYSGSIIFKILCLLIFFYLIYKIIGSYHGLHFIAENLAVKNPKENEILLSALEFNSRKTADNYSREIIQAEINQANEISKKVTFKNNFSLQKIYFSLKLFVVSLVMVIILALSFPVSVRQTFRTLINIQSFEPHFDSFIEVIPGNKVVLKGSNLEVRIENFYPELNYELVFMKNLRSKKIELSKSAYTFYNIDDSLDYFFRNDFAVSDTFTISVLEKPAVKNLTIQYDYPAYAKLLPKIEKDASGNIFTLTGTNIKFSIEVNNQLTDARIIFSDGQTVQMSKVEAKQYSANFKITKSLTYYFYLEDVLGNKNSFIRRTIYAEDDLPPQVKITFPAEDRILAQNLTETINYSASDDFGISELGIVYKKNDGEFIHKNIDVDANITNLNGSYIFDLNEHRLFPGDVIAYYLQIWDNCSEPEKQSSKSRIYLLKFPSIEELYEEIDKQQESKYENLAETLEKAKKNKKKFEDLRRKYLKNEELDWEQKDELKETLENQKEMAELAEKTAEEYKKFVEQIEKNKAVSKETLEKLKKIQEIMKDIATPELMDAIKKMQESLENVDQEQMKKAMEQFKSMQEDFLKKLDETLKLLEKIKLEQNMQKILQQAEEMEKLQKDLNENAQERMDNNSDMSDLSEKQKEISEKYESLKEEIQKQIEELEKNQKNKSANELREALEQAEKNEMSPQMQQSAQQMQANKKQNLSKMQQSIQQSMSSMKNSIQKAQQSMQGMAMAEFQKLIDKTIFNLLYFSGIQEKILGNNYKSFEVLDEEIAIYDGIQNVMKELFKNPLIILILSPKFSPHVASLINDFDSMFDQLRNRRTYNIQKDKERIFSGINLLVYDLLQSSGGGQQGGGGGMQQLMQQLQKMGQQQGGVTMLAQALMQQMMEQMGQGQGLSPQQRKMMDRIAGNEQRIKENLERVLRDFPEAEKLMGNLQSLGDEINEVLKKLNKGIIDQDLIEKQQHIHSRLLDAQRSIHKRDFSNKRKAKTPELFEYATPDSLRINKNSKEVKDVLKFINENYPEEFHNLIKKYLEKIQYEQK
ncbi:MAG: DUF4175 family protein [Candidatus Cloacimonadota bacterium]|nr:DUF4175 family protein [Candidatus Cloacimonadota bacterium]